MADEIKRKPIIFGSNEPVVAKAPEPPPSSNGGWDKAIGQIATATPAIARKSKPWPSKKMYDSPMSKQNGGTDNA